LIPPIVSIITPSFNAAKFIAETIQSVRNQTFENWEMIIVDDASTDNTEEVVKAVSEGDPRIVFERLSNNSGTAVARNRGLELSRGRFIAFLDSDDLWDPNKLELQLAFIEARKAPLVYAKYRVITDDNQPLSCVDQIPDQLQYKDLLKNTIIGTLTVMIDTNKVKNLRFKDYRTGQDLLLWLDILRDGSTAHGQQEILATYRIVRGSISRNKVKKALRIWHFYRQVEKIPLLPALWYFTNYAWNAFKKNIKVFTMK